MGRGLSGLQQTILRLALAGTQRPPNMVETALGVIDANAHRPHDSPPTCSLPSTDIAPEQRRAGGRQPGI